MEISKPRAKFIAEFATTEPEHHPQMVRFMSGRNEVCVMEDAIGVGVPGLGSLTWFSSIRSARQALESDRQAA